MTEYPTPTADSAPAGITAGPDGALWFTEFGDTANKIGRITTDGDFTEYQVSGSNPGPYKIAAGPDGALWFTEFRANKIGRITTDGDITAFQAPTAPGVLSQPYGIAAGPDGALWFAQQNYNATTNHILRITTDGDITEYPTPTPVSYVTDIAAGADGALWFTEQVGGIGRITTDGDTTEYPVGSSPYDITAGPDGALWFTEYWGNNIGRITTDGDVTEFPIPTPDSHPLGVAAGPDGALWFAESGTSKIGRITTDGDVTEFPIPTANTRPIGVVAGSDGALWFVESEGDSIGRITTDSTMPVGSTSQDVPAGTTVATNTATTPDDPVGTSVTTPAAGTVTIEEGTSTTPDPSGYSLLGQQIEITAPAATAAEPLVLEFALDASVLPPGVDETTVEVFRNGTAIADCDAGAGTTATPDPCVAARDATAGGIELTVRTSHASAWNFGLAVAPDTTITSGPSGTTNDPTPTFAFSSSQAGSSFQCKLDSGGYAACSSPKTTARLTDGPHTFSVRATKNALTDSTPATRSFTAKTAAVSRSGKTLTVTAAPGAKDNLVITRPSASVLRVADLASGPYTGSGVHVGAGCTRDGDNAANCTSAAMITSIKVASGDLDDKVRNSTAIKSSLDGGTGADTLSGGSANDTLTGAAGLDVLKGMAGGDLLKARDLASDATIDCGVGTDNADLDLLPLDPNSVVKGCETKTRH